jgi:hypothetical protein
LFDADLAEGEDDAPLVLFQDLDDVVQNGEDYDDGEEKTGGKDLHGNPPFEISGFLSHAGLYACKPAV